MDVRDKLLFEPEYAGNTKEKIPPKSSLRVPWSWLPGALCLLQEVELLSYTILFNTWQSFLLISYSFVQRYLLCFP